MSDKENKSEVIIDENDPFENHLTVEEPVENEEPGSAEELPEGSEEEKEEEESTDGGESEDEDQEAETAEEPKQTESIDDLEIPEPDLKELTPADYKAIRQEKQRKREEQRQEELREEAFRQEQEVLIQARADQAALVVAVHAPNRDDFGDDASYYTALHNHTTAKEEVRRKVIADEKAWQEARIKLSKDINETRRKGSERYSDFEEVTAYVFAKDSKVPANVPLAEAINESKFGTDILYMLAKNEKKMIEIAGMHPRAALRWLWDMEQKIEAVRRRKKENGIAASAVSPKPMAKVQSKSTPHKDIASMSVKEYSEHYKKNRDNW